MIRKVVVWGAGGHARVVADTLRLGRHHEIAGFLDDVRPERHGEEFCGALVLGGREKLFGLRAAGVTEILVAVGDCVARQRLADVARAAGFALATAVHPRAVVASDVVIGAGTLVVAGAVINPAVTIGENVIINTSASVDHDCVIENGVHVGPGVHLAGQVTVGRGAWVGMGAIIVERVRIGPGAVIGAGSVVLTDIPDGVVAYGAPAKVVQRSQPV
jgi:acetyltransferase EpsM